MSKVTLKERITTILKSIGRPASIKEIAAQIDDKPESTIRGRLYENLDVVFKRVTRGVYWFTNEAAGVGLVEGNGRDLSVLDDSSIDAIVCDHPWEDNLSLKGGNRHIDSSYDSFKYTLEDFQEKARVLKNGGYLVEVLPSENASNFRYLFSIKDMAEKCGLNYYAKVPWVKGTFVSNQGRKSSNTEDIMFFTKGKSRALRPDVKRTKATGQPHYMSGTKKMLPTAFNIQPVPVRERLHQAEKPVSLYEEIIELITFNSGEIILDQTAGSGSLGIAAIRKNCFAVLFEILSENVVTIKERLMNEFNIKPFHELTSKY